MKLSVAVAIAALPILLTAGACGNAATSHQQAGQHSPREVLDLQGRVTDAARIFPPEVRQRLETRLEALEHATGHQMVVVTTPSLGGEDIAAYTRALGNRWGIGRKDHDDGVIILVAPRERKVRIAVGYGLEKVLTDSLCSQVIEHDMIPRFGTGDFAGGAEAAVTVLAAKLS